MTPMLRQYFKAKDENPGCLLLFRCGDFFETYGGDAETASRELEIVLTSKDAGNGSKIAMAGVPYFALDQYLPTLVKKGFRVAICDQVEDARKAKGLVKREVVRIVTSGTILEPEMLDRKKNNYIVSIVMVRDMVGMALGDISTGDFHTTEFPFTGEEPLIEEVDRWNPSEALLSKTLMGAAGLAGYLQSGMIVTSEIKDLPDGYRSEELLRAHFNVNSLMGTGLYEHQSALCASAALLDYLKQTQKSMALHFRLPKFFSRDGFMFLDSTSKRNLELVETMMGRERTGSMLWSCDLTCTAMGARLIRDWIVKPLLDKGEIEQRLDAVEELTGSPEIVRTLTISLKKMQDVERLLSKAIFGTCNARDLVGLCNSLEHLPALAQQLERTKANLLCGIARLDLLEDVNSLLQASLEASPPATVREGGIIREGVDGELDDLRTIRKNAREWITRMEERERERTGIKSLKVGFNQVFGYYIEITRSNLKMVPAEYIRKQTIANGERYISPELKEYEAKVLSADERIKNLEYEIFNRIREQVVSQSRRIQETAASIAILDVLLSFAVNAMENDYCRPQVVGERIVDIKDGRHPVIEKILKEAYIRNDVYLDDDERMIIVTGPNMSGKSTYLRQTALMVILAQIGSFVPAREARIGIVDRIFTRVGATDDLHLGQSTFMVEMLETAHILNNATESSLVILDEIGRGTSTYDGLSIAWAVAEHLFNKIKAKTLFATHFHELTRLSKLYKGIKNRKVAVKETKDEVIFLHKILPGASDKSYGIYVAKLAGFPAEILDTAKEILDEMETAQRLSPRKDSSFEKKPAEQLTFFEESSNPVIDEIRKLNIVETTPLEALNKIYKWQKSIERFKSRNLYPKSITNGMIENVSGIQN